MTNFRKDSKSLQYVNFPLSGNMSCNQMFTELSSYPVIAPLQVRPPMSPIKESGLKLSNSVLDRSIPERRQWAKRIQKRRGQSPEIQLLSKPSLHCRFLWNSAERAVYELRIYGDLIQGLVNATPQLNCRSFHPSLIYKNKTKIQAGISWATYMASRTFTVTRRDSSLEKPFFFFLTKSPILDRGEKRSPQAVRTCILVTQLSFSPKIIGATLRCALEAQTVEQQNLTRAGLVTKKTKVCFTHHCQGSRLPRTHKPPKP